MDDSAIACDEVIDADVKLRPKDDDGTKTIPSNFYKKKRTCKINYQNIIDSCQY